MSTKQDQLMKLTIDFNVLLMNDEMPLTQRISKLLQIQSQFDILPNQASKDIFQLQCNLCLGQCYIKAHQKYKLTPLVEECKQLLLQMEEHDFATQPQEVYGYLAERQESYYGELIALCQAKNHQQDIAHLHQQVARIWDRVGNEKNCIRAFVLSNIALAKVPGKFALTKEQLVEQFAENKDVVDQAFEASKGLKTDPIEQTPEYIAIYDQAERIIQGLIEQQGRLSNTPDQYWNIKAEVLQLHFGMQWKSPRSLNPGVKF